MHNNPAIRKVFDIYTQRKTGTNAVITMVTVNCFEEKTEKLFPADKLAELDVDEITGFRAFLKNEQNRRQREFMAQCR